MLWWKKTKSWCFHHWRVLVVTGIALAAFLLGRKNVSRYKVQAQMAKELYQKEKKIIEEAHRNKSTKKDEALDSYKEAMAIANRKYMKSRDELEKKRAARVAELVEANRNDPEIIDRIFEKEFGFKISEKK
jgi:hypothetical protein